MASDTRGKNVRWNIGLPDSGGRRSWDAAKVALLMDIRDELQAIRRRLDCHETLAIPRVLRKISSNTANLPKKEKS